MYKRQRNCENVNKKNFSGVGNFQIPAIASVHYESCEFIGFNYAKSCKKAQEKGIHFFIDDYQFLRLWNQIDRYVALLKPFKYVMSPDFSTYMDYPKALQIYNHYRKHWIAAYLQVKNISIIPTISWSDASSYAWCFDGEPENSCIAISSVGTQRNQETKQYFLNGYQEMIKRLHPEQIIFYGEVPRECKGNIIKITPFQEKFKECQCDGW